MTPLENAEKKLAELHSYNTKLDLSNLKLSSDDLRLLMPKILVFPYLLEINLSYNVLTSLPSEFKQLINVKILNLSQNNFESMPVEIGELKKLNILNLSANKLDFLSHIAGNLSHLTALYLGENNIKNISPEIGKLKTLEILSLYSNKLTSLPDEIGELESLKNLILFNNQLKFLPDKIIQLKKLETVLLNNNALTTVPLQIIKLNQSPHDNRRLVVNDNPLNAETHLLIAQVAEANYAGTAEVNAARASDAITYLDSFKFALGNIDESTHPLNQNLGGNDEKKPAALDLNLKETFYRGPMIESPVEQDPSEQPISGFSDFDIGNEFSIPLNLEKNQESNKELRSKEKEQKESTIKTNVDPANSAVNYQGNEGADLAILSKPSPNNKVEINQYLTVHDAHDETVEKVVIEEDKNTSTKRREKDSESSQLTPASRMPIPTKDEKLPFKKRFKFDDSKASRKQKKP